MSLAPIESPFIVRGEQRRAGSEARAILAEARDEAASILAQAEADRDDVLRQAREQGLAEGLAEAANIAVEAADAIDRFWVERERELRDLALAVAHRVLSDLPPGDLLARLASEAIAEHARDVRLALRTTPDAAESLRAVFEARGYADRVEVVGDPASPPGSCALLHPRGRTEVGLIDQFRAMLDTSRGPAAGSTP